MDVNPPDLACDDPARNEAPVALATFSRRQCLAIAALAEGESVWEVKMSVGVPRSTTYRWLKKPQFVAAIHRIRKEWGRPRLEIARLLDDPQTERHIRVRAAENLKEMVKKPEPDLWTRNHRDKMVRHILSLLQ